MSDPIDSALNRWRSAIDAELARAPDPAFELPEPLRDAVRYSLSGGGKRLRGLLLMATHEALGGSGDASALAASIEIVHAYSLVHDDLPAMDNDHLRRGMPTTHRQCGVDVATVAGVVMVPIAVHHAISGARRLGLDDRAVNAIVALLMRASGGGGMVGGQLLDLDAERQQVAIADLEGIHRAKTGALISAAFHMAGLAARAPEGTLEALVEAGDAFGLAFQIADDVLDATSSAAALGKSAGIDAALAKSTYVSVLGVSEARARAQALIEHGMTCLEGRTLRTPALERLARFIAARRS